MHLPRSVASAAIALATALVVVVPAQAGLAATRPTPSATAVTTTAGPAKPQRTIVLAAPVTVPSESDPQGGPTGEHDAFDDEGAGDVAIVDGTDASDDDDRAGDVQMVDGTDAVDGDVPMIDGTDAVGDDSDVLADDFSSSAGSPPVVRRDRTTGRWARVALPTGVRATLTGASRARVTWRAGVSGVPAQQYVVELRAGASVLRTRTFRKARSVVVWGLAAGKRYAVTVTAVAADGTRRAGVGAPVRTPAASAAERAPIGAEPAPRPVATRAPAVRPR